MIQDHVIMRIGIVTISDRASRGIYEDLSGPAIAAWLTAAIRSPWIPERRVIPDGVAPVRDTLIDLADTVGAGLIFTTGGTGPAPRDLTPEAMAMVITREMPGFGEMMRRVSAETVPTAILSRQTAGIRGRCLIVNLPGKPTAIAVCLAAIFPAIPYCLDLMEAGRIETDPAVVESVRPAATSAGAPQS